MIDWNDFRSLYEANMKDRVERFVFRFHEQFAGIDFRNKTILEVGCGKGFLSLYLMLFTKAKSVTALDESIGKGSEKDVLNLLKKIVLQEAPVHLTVVETNFFDYHPPYPFDMIIANYCLHHFCDNGAFYFDNPEVKSCYVKLFQHLRRLLSDNGTLCIGELDPHTVCSAFFSKQLYPKIEWSLHPPFNAWVDALKAADFKSIATKTHTPYRLRHIQRIVQWNVFRKMLKGNAMIYAVK